MIHAAELIRRKRDGEELSGDELSELLLAYARKDVPDYQMSAFCMAVHFQGLSEAETFALTDAMIRSGDTLALGEALGRKVVDKHSTGGVGDKTTIAVAPIVAACGVPFGKMSGRGLGHTGGTLDKLESIPGFRVELSTEEFIAQIRDVGIAVIGQTGDLVPADKDLYALRDVTATVDNFSLIAASIMSKKIAAGADAIVLDVKVGEGAFMRTIDDARVLADAMAGIGRRSGREVVCLLTDMSEPLGVAVGNALEIREAVRMIEGEGPEDFTELVLTAVSELLALSDLGLDQAAARERAEAVMQDGSARKAYDRWIAAQGGDASLEALPTAAVVHDVTAPGDGYVTGLNALEVGQIALKLGAGRAQKGDDIDHSVGLDVLAKTGRRVAQGDVVARVHARTSNAAEQAATAYLETLELGPKPAGERKLILEVRS